MDHRAIEVGTLQPLDSVAAFAADELRQARLAQRLRECVMDPLIALRMDAAWMRTHLGDSRTLQGKLDEAVGLLANALSAIKDVADGLRPLTLDDLGPAAALESLLQPFARDRGIVCDLNLDARLAVEQPRTIILYRIVQDWLESLPAHTGRLGVVLGADASDMVLTLRAGKASPLAKDDAAVAACNVSQALRARVQMLHGSLSAQENSSSEASLVVRIPLRAAPAG